MKAILTLKNLNKVFERPPQKPLLALQGINLEIFEEEFFVILGPSGSGKSTLLRILSGLEKDYRGSLTYGQGIEKKDISFVFQQFALFPWLTVFENIELGILTKENDRQKRRLRVNDELKEFGLGDFSHAYPKELSGGMKQRVGLARALVGEPKVLFMDEPFSELDSFTAQALRKELLTLWQKRKPTVVMVTHLLEEAVELADRIAVLTPRPGKIEGILENHLPRPRDRRSSGFYNLEDNLYKLVKP